MGICVNKYEKRKKRENITSRDEIIRFCVTAFEKYALQCKAKSTGLFVSEYFRKCGLGREHLQNLGLADRQYLMTVHLSTDQPHIHLQVNRIDFFGKAHNDHIIGLKSQESAEKIAKRLGLTTAKEFAKMKTEKTEKLRQFLSEINKKAILEVTTFSAYCEFIEKYNIEIKATIRKNGELQGYNFLDKKSGEVIKASKVSGAGLKRLIEKGIEINHKTTQIYAVFSKSSMALFEVLIVKRI